MYGYVRLTFIHSCSLEREGCFEGAMSMRANFKSNIASSVNKAMALVDNFNISLGLEGNGVERTILNAV